MTIFMCGLIVILCVIFIYQLVVRYNIETIEFDSPKMKRKINYYKFQENDRSLIMIMIAVIVLCLVLFGVLYGQNDLRRNNKNLELKIEELSESGGSSIKNGIEQYQEKTLKLTEFPWVKVVQSRDTNAQDNYELQLIRDLQPFLGESNVSIVIGQKTDTLTISVFPTALTYNDFQTAKENMETMINELQSVKEIAIIDFNFTYRDKANKLSKESIVYSRNTKEDNLEKVNLNK